MRYSLLSFLAATMLLLSGCFGINQPTDEAIQNMSEQQFNQQYVGLFTATQVQKDNGYKQNDTHYVAEMTIKARAERSVDEYARQIMEDSSLTAFEKMSQTVNLGLLKMTMPEFQTGDELEFKKDYLFIKTDKGWLLKKELTQDDSSNSI
ncbi:MAG: hypothetical protein R3189_06770 [Thiomicrorhabdus chilensis]|uniref:hypothetical protein n=1 Tax=Thiomicrorhabdus chilensis TaxID=63656 RepID=UPI00299E527F|nr:hypothetical protein [Thiomicrorhabdus chilensis]MDX1347935.1 hypothetical protein [Thiomicrorhabdus chilensis]